MQQWKAQRIRTEEENEDEIERAPYSPLFVEKSIEKVESSIQIKRRIGEETILVLESHF